MSLTMRKVSTQTRYRISMDDRDVYEMLKIAYSANVARCGYIFSEDAETQKKIHGMAGWLTSSKAKPGMLLCGTCGNGKTTLAESAREVINTLLNPESSPNVIPHVPQMIRINALKITQAYTEQKGEYERWKVCPMLMIDDLGVEPAEIRVYGNVVSPLVEMLYERYDRKLMTVITSNLTKKAIGEVYGPRIVERVIEMCNIMAFTHKSYRK